MPVLHVSCVSQGVQTTHQASAWIARLQHKPDQHKDQHNLSLSRGVMGYHDDHNLSLSRTRLEACRRRLESSCTQTDSTHSRSDSRSARSLSPHKLRGSAAAPQTPHKRAPADTNSKSPGKGKHGVRHSSDGSRFLLTSPHRQPPQRADGLGTLAMAEGSWGGARRSGEGQGGASGVVVSGGGGRQAGEPPPLAMRETQGKEGGEGAGGQGEGGQVQVLRERLRLSQEMIEELQASNMELDKALHVALAVTQSSSGAEDGLVQAQGRVQQLEREQTEALHESARAQQRAGELEAQVEAERQGRTVAEKRLEELQEVLRAQELRRLEDDAAARAVEEEMTRLQASLAQVEAAALEGQALSKQREANAAQERDALRAAHLARSRALLAQAAAHSNARLLSLLRDSLSAPTRAATGQREEREAAAAAAAALSPASSHIPHPSSLSPASSLSADMRMSLPPSAGASAGDAQERKQTHNTCALGLEEGGGIAPERAQARDAALWQKLEGEDKGMLDAAKAQLDAAFDKALQVVSVSLSLSLSLSLCVCVCVCLCVSPAPDRGRLRAELQEVGIMREAMQTQYRRQVSQLQQTHAKERAEALRLKAAEVQEMHEMFSAKVETAEQRAAAVRSREEEDAVALALEKQKLRETLEDKAKLLEQGHKSELQALRARHEQTLGSLRRAHQVSSPLPCPSPHIPRSRARVPPDMHACVLSF
jgi:hypothetical protein